jgi:hypothetical protein
MMGLLLGLAVFTRVCKREEEESMSLRCIDVLVCLSVWG